MDWPEKKRGRRKGALSLRAFSAEWFSKFSSEPDDAHGKDVPIHSCYVDRCRSSRIQVFHAGLTHTKLALTFHVERFFEVQLFRRDVVPKHALMFLFRNTCVPLILLGGKCVKALERTEKLLLGLIYRHRILRMLTVVEVSNIFPKAVNGSLHSESPI